MAEHGFATPVFEAQRVFRTLLTVLAEPGRVLPLSTGCAPPNRIDPGAAAIVLALCDADTPLWLSPSMAAAGDYFRFHTGALIVARAGDAQFLLATAAEQPPLATLQAGTADYPDHSATLIVAVDALAEGSGWRLSGPGIPETRGFLARPVDQSFARQWRENHARFPLGVDLFFVARDCVAGLPRSVRLEE
jgi:alpha-D-ribose 1-methylphosphonate 5-triphosphate synthase subunit PhnH